MTDREIKRITTLVKNCIYDDVNANYSDNEEVLKYVLRINKEYMDNWVKDVLTYEKLWQDPERLYHESK